MSGQKLRRPTRRRGATASCANPRLQRRTKHHRKTSRKKQPAGRSLEGQRSRTHHFDGCQVWDGRPFVRQDTIEYKYVGQLYGDRTVWYLLEDTSFVSLTLMGLNV